VCAAARRGGRGGEGGGGRAQRPGEVAERQHGGVGGAHAAARLGGEGGAPVRVRAWCGGDKANG